MKPERLQELTKKVLKSYIKKANTSADRLDAKGDKEEDKAMSTDGMKYPEKQARHQAAASKAQHKAWGRRKGIDQAEKRLKEEQFDILTEEQLIQLDEELNLILEDLADDVGILLEKAPQDMVHGERMKHHLAMHDHHMALHAKSISYASQGNQDHWHNIAKLHKKKAEGHLAVRNLLKKREQNKHGAAYRERKANKTTNESVEQIDELTGKGKLSNLQADSAIAYHSHDRDARKNRARDGLNSDSGWKSHVKSQIAAHANHQAIALKHGDMNLAKKHRAAKVANKSKLKEI